ncbi:MAG TPA: hypothetical protein VF848_08575, partial [Steroidobacteraceae bacterium]
ALPFLGATDAASTFIRGKDCGRRKTTSHARNHRNCRNCRTNCVHWRSYVALLQRICEAVPMNPGLQAQDQYGLDRSLVIAIMELKRPTCVR